MYVLRRRLEEVISVRQETKRKAKMTESALLQRVGGFELQVVRRALIGSAPQGLRGVGHLGEGRSLGPRLAGKVLEGGADWWTLRRDGIMEVDVKFIIQTDDEAAIQVAYTGVVDFGPDGYETVLAGRPPELPPKPRVTPRLTTSDARYEWVNRSQFVAFGEIDYSVTPAVVRYGLYRLI